MAERKPYGMHVKAEDTISIIDAKGGITLAVLRLDAVHGIEFMWMAQAFDDMPMRIRRDIIKRLRDHADLLENGDMDRQVKECLEEAKAADANKKKKVQ